MSNRSRLEGLFVTLLATGALAASACSGGSSSESTPPTTHDASTGDGGVTPEGDGGTTHPKALLGPSHGSMVMISDDDSRVVVANRDVGTATVFSIDYTTNAPLPTLTKVAEIDVGAEPSQVVIHPNNDTAFVLSRKDQKLTRIDGLQTTPTKGAEVAVGSEPTGLAMVPSGATVWVANWIDGTVMEVATDTMKVTATIDLNATLAASGMLGQGLAARPSFAHPRAIAITNNGDLVDADETVYVTEYAAQHTAPLAADGSNGDVNKSGVLYKIPIAQKQATTIELPPMPDMGYADVKGNVAGCFPNQVTSLAIQGAFGYAISVCASPRGPVGGLSAGPAAAVCANDAACPGAVVGSCVTGKCTTNCTTDAQCGVNGGQCMSNVCATNPANVKAVSAPVVSIVDLGGNKTIATVNLTKEFEKYFTSISMPDDATRRFPLLPTDVGFVPGTVTAYFAASGSDAVFRVDFDATYQGSTIDSVGDPKNPFINLAPAAVDPSRVGKLPVGIAVAHKTHGDGTVARYAYTANEATRNVVAIDLANQEVAGLSAGTPVGATSSPMPTDPTQAANLEGRRMFITGLGRWSWKGQSWLSCATCHGDGFSDNVTWFSGKGPRQAPSLDGSYASSDPHDYRVNTWTATFDEPTDHEGAIRSFAGGVGAIVKDMSLDMTSRLAYDVEGQSGLNGSSWAAADPKNPANLAATCVIDDWQKIATWMQLLRSPRRPSNLDPTKVAAGKALFAEGKCAGCHSGAKWTISSVFYAPDPIGNVNKNLATTTWTAAVTTAGFPTALLPAATPAMQTMRYGGTNKTSFDQMTCVLRPVGTFGVAEADVGVIELRSDGITAAQGAEVDGNGFNPPSLLGMSVGAPYFHGGQVRTLETMFSEMFAGHFRALNPTFLAASDSGRADKVSALVQYVLSIDEDEPTIAIPALGPNGGSFCATQ